MSSRGRHVGVAKATEYAQMIVFRRVTMKELVRGDIAAWFAGTAIESVSGRGKSFRPECRGHVCVEQERTNAVVKSAKKRSAWPFCCDVYGQVSRSIMLLEERKERKA